MSNALISDFVGQGFYNENSLVYVGNTETISDNCCDLTNLGNC